MNATLQVGLKALAQRTIRIGMLAGSGWAMVCALGALLIFAWADLVTDLPPELRLGADVIALVLLSVMLILALMRSLRASRESVLARRVDAVARSGGQVLAGVDLASSSQSAGAAITRGLANIAVERAALLMSRVSPLDAVPAQPAQKSFWVFGGSVAALLFVALLAPRMLATQYLRFADPYGDHPPYSRVVFDISPGGARVIYGKSFDVQAKTSGAMLDHVDLVHRSGSTEESLPMFPQSDGNWTATLAGVTSGGEYYVRAGRARSYRYPIDVITVPRIESVRFRITPPAYTNAGAYEGPLPQAGISGLPGTKVEMWAKSNRPLAGGTVQLTADVATTRPSPGSIALTPDSADKTEVSGAFTIAAGGKMSLAISDIAGQPSTDPFAAPITLLTDARPFVRVLEPRPESLATADVMLKVVLSAEDDYGISRLQLFRSLNDSTASAADLPVRKPPPTRQQGESFLKLAEYGLKPGDVIKLFGRVEDTDPAGAKGAESSVVTVRIISQEEMQKLMLARDAMEVLQSKYEQAARRLERLDEEMKRLQDEITKQDLNKPIDEKLRKALDQLAQEAQRDAQAMRDAQKIDLPIDIDRAMTKQLGELAQRTDELSKQAHNASTQPSISYAGANDKLNEMRKQLGVCRGDFQKETTFPLEHLAKIFPLIEDEAIFLELYHRQRDLSERMSTLKGQDKQDDPKLKARMRDLAEEQRQNREDLRMLLDQIDDHLAALPADERLKDLKETARKFADGVRASEAAAQMNDTETALNDFSGTRAGEEAKNAADTLEKFIARCNSMGGEARACLKFQPELASGLGNSIDQLLDSMNMGMGNTGGGTGGYSARHSSLANVGLYGNIPTRGEWASSGNGGQAKHGVGADGRGKGDDNSDPSAIGAIDKTNAAGESDAAVPAQYRRRVGEYFQRVADELGDK